MTLAQMLYFQVVCKHENYTKAAHELHITQPAMSVAMRDLERECGVPLFIRDKNSLQITDEGYVLLEQINLVLKQYEHTMHIVKNLSLSRKYIRIAFSTLSGNHVYPYLISRFLERHPDIQIIPAEESTKKQFEMLDSNQLDIILTVKRYDNQRQQQEFDEIYGHWSLMTTRLLFCVSRKHPLSSGEEISIEQMAQIPLVLLKDNFSQTIRLKEMFARKELTPNVIHYTNQMYTIERFIEQNIAAGFLPQAVARQNPEIKGLVYPDTEQHIEIFWRKDRFQFQATKLFINLVKELFPN